MQTLIWAFGAMLVLILIIAFLPIGFTFRGKFFVVSAGFVLALGGLAAVPFFPLWQTSLIVLLLVLVAAYIMDSRFGAVMYNKVLDSFDIEFDEESKTFVPDNRIEKSMELDLLDLDQGETASQSLMNLNANEVISIQVQPQNVDENEQTYGIEIEDISFFDDLIEDEIKEKNEKNMVDTDSEAGNLSDIESLLLAESNEKTESEDEGWLEEFNHLTLGNVEEETVSIATDVTELDEIFLAVKETAAGDDANLYELDDNEIEAGYLSDIESLLQEESEENIELEDEGWLEKLNDLTPIGEEETGTNALEDNQLDELFLAVKETAAGYEANLLDSNLKKEVNLQK
ncbi:hypothetical protein KW850_12090 [Bacillus sp. sid0103]|uniref:hypothetical protein n=1 Tax=Bacillus sp. sid0103 TaxID=2856337 RepID=UPI001C4463D9|nr:hypothetical protein [Bacillus sp. sid0103]MBV7505997.1 hypothetical protein [Bacillus sp. sid0103]